MATDRFAHERVDSLLERVVLVEQQLAALHEALAELATLIDPEAPAPDPDGVKPGSEA